MVIHLTPVRRQFQSHIFEKRDVLQKPFPFMSGAQALFSSGREALLYGIRLLDNLSGKIHIPAYCCRSVLSPLKKLRLNTKFYDVGNHLEPIMDNIEFDRGDIFLLIHYFGIPQDALSIDQLCRERGMVLIEDCAHALPDPEARHTMGSTGAFSIYSLRKQLPVPDGGVLVVNDSKAKDHVAGLALPKLRRTPAKKWLINSLDRFAFTVRLPNTLILKDTLRDILGSTDNVFYARISDDAVPEISRITAQVLGQMDINSIVKIRRENYYCMVDYLSGIQGITVPFPSLPEGAVPQAFPVLLNDADRICAFMRKKGIGAGRWPGYELPEQITLSDFPGTASWVKSLLLLPLHQDLNAVYIEKIIQTIKKLYITGERI